MPKDTLLIDATHTKKGYLKEIFRHRELLYFFAWRDLLVRYKQAFFGIAWALFRPLMNMAVFAFLFGKIAQFPSEQVNYALFVLAAMLPWQLFSNSIVDGCNSLVNNASLISKIYFPRILIPIAQIMVHFLEFAITGGLLVALALLMGDLKATHLLCLPFFILLLSALSLAISFWLSALTVKYRDFRIVVPFLVQFGIFISPVGYGTFIIPEKWLWLYFLNPMTGIIDGFRWSFFGISYPQMWSAIITSTLLTCIMLWTGFCYFRKMERSFADQI
jgi:lipopolysaccharide transport system permease protein